jgi:predicted TPR repeat methyltransferase
MKYWKEHFNENAVKFKTSLLKQVDMTVNGNEVNPEQIELRINAIKQNLSLRESDILLDICCGNGLITERLSDSVKLIYGVDFSEGLIEIAKNNQKATNLKYEVGDITKINLQNYDSITKINVYAGLQYISLKELQDLLKKIKSYPKPLIVYCANVPDKEKIWNYYDTEEKRKFYQERESAGKPHIGTWFYKNDIARAADALEVSYKFLEIDKRLNTSNYRFDIIFSTKPS